jgi:hypothetical protein
VVDVNVAHVSTVPVTVVAVPVWMVVDAIVLVGMGVVVAEVVAGVVDGIASHLQLHTPLSVICGGVTSAMTTVRVATTVLPPPSETV